MIGREEGGKMLISGGRVKGFGGRGVIELSFGEAAAVP